MSRSKSRQPRNGGPPGPAKRKDLPHPANRSAPIIGILEWFRPGDQQRVEDVVADLQLLGVRELRTGVSWADWHTPQGQEWYAWLLPRLAKVVRVLPCFVYTPPSLGTAHKISSPPRDPKAYADFLDLMITRFGQYFDWVELWNEPNNLRHWDITIDPYWRVFSEMINAAAYWCKQRGKKTVLGGMAPVDPSWLRLMCERGLIQHIDAVGIHGYPIALDSHWEGWMPLIRRTREVLDEYKSPAEIWITETGYSTWRHDERRQLTTFVDAIDSPAHRVYWYAARDRDPKLPTADGLQLDEREYHYGLKRFDGGGKLLYRLWAEGGIQAVRDAYWLGRPVANGRNDRPVLITGGAGFIGTNLAHRILSEGRTVVLLDNLSRPGVERNLHWLRESHGDRVQVEVSDVRDPYVLRRVVQRASQVFHFAAQVAVTTSLTNSIHDFEVNARGTLNLLEAIRALDNPPPLVFTSTNKVYGGLPDVRLQIQGSRYQPEDPILREYGIGENRCLDFHSPYGCSKGTADQYVLDYARTFGLPTVVFRMSCIYGLHQMGTEDQGWVAHFLIRALQRQPITLFGDGMQVRDVLFIDDLVNAFLLAQKHVRTIGGQAFNIGGGPKNAISLMELLALIGQIDGQAPKVRFGSWRPGDQRYYVSDTRKFGAATGWSPQVDVRQGVERLYRWLCDSGLAHKPANHPASKHSTACGSGGGSNGALSSSLIAAAKEVL
ncbi:MAG: NAD-dependent epimerase/dehydratase family protein [Bacillota bacterium]